MPSGVILVNVLHYMAKGLGRYSEGYKSENLTIGRLSWILQVCLISSLEHLIDEKCVDVREGCDQPLLT